MRCPFIKLPTKTEATLLLIREELKSRSFFNRLDKVGFLGPSAQTHLYALIADNLGIDIHRDEDFEEFDSILEDASEMIEPDMENEDLMTVVLKVYVRLVAKEDARKTIIAMTKRSKRKNKKIQERRLSLELDQQFAWFLEHVSPKHFSRALRGTIVDLSSNLDQSGTPLWMAEFANGLQLLFRALDAAEDEGKYSDKDIYDR